MKQIDISLKIPLLSELSFRRKMLSDPKTMAYNTGWGVFDGYNPQTGCIDFCREKWSDWYDKWMNKKDRFYAYIYANDLPVGDAAFRYDEQSNTHTVHLLIKDDYRGCGFAKKALKKLIEIAFNEYDVEVLSDNFEASREESLKLFTDAGFVITKEHTAERFGKKCKMVLLELKKQTF